MFIAKIISTFQFPKEKMVEIALQTLGFFSIEDYCQGLLYRNRSCIFVEILFNLNKLWITRNL